MQRKFTAMLFATSITLLGWSYLATAADDATARAAETAAPLLRQALAGIPGKEVVMVTVNYAPGASSAPHRHNANTFVYVLEGSVVMQVAGGKPVTLTAGQTFYESPSDIHAVSRNASNTQPAKILAILVKDENQPATVPVSREEASAAPKK